MRARVDPRYVKLVKNTGRTHLRGQMMYCPKTMGFTRTDILHHTLREWDVEGNCVDTAISKFTFSPELPIYTDGSCFRGSDPLLASAGSSAVQVHADGSPFKAVLCTLPDSKPQSAASGEHYGAYLAAHYSRRDWVIPTVVCAVPQASRAPPPRILADCASVVRSAQDREYAVDGRRPFAGTWGRIQIRQWPIVEKQRLIAPRRKQRN